MEYKLTAKQGGKNIVLHYEEKSNCEIKLTIGRPVFTGMKIIYDSFSDRNRVKRKERQSDYNFTSDTMAYYRNLLEAMGIETVVGAGDLSAMTYFLTGKSTVEPVYVPDELTVAYDKLKENNLTCHVTLRQGMGSTAQFYLHEEKLELFVSSTKPNGQPEYDSHDDSIRPMHGIIDGIADLNYRRHLHYQFMLAKLGIEMSTRDAFKVLEKFIWKAEAKEPKMKSQSDVYHYEGGRCSNGHWNLDFVIGDDGIVQLIATSVVRFLPDSILYNSIMDPNCPPITNAPAATINAVRLKYFKKKLAGLRMEMRPARWQEVFNKFTKGKDSMSYDQEPKVISKREMQIGKFNLLVEFTEDMKSRVRLVIRDESHGNNSTMYDSLRDNHAPVQHSNSLLDHLHACFSYYPMKLAVIGASAHVDWWYSVYQDFVGLLHEEVHFHGELKFEKPSFRPRNLIAVLLKVAPNYPRGEIVPDEVRDTLKALIEHRCIRITGVVDEKKYFSPREISLQGPSLPNPDRRDVNFFFNEQDGYPVTIFADVLKGVEFDFVLIEPDPTQKTVVRSWVFTNSHISTFVGVPPVRDLALDLNDRSTEVKYVFNGEQSTSGAVLAMAKQILLAMNVQSANPYIKKL